MPYSTVAVFHCLRRKDDKITQHTLLTISLFGIFVQKLTLTSVLNLYFSLNIEEIWPLKHPGRQTVYSVFARVENVV